MKKQVVVLGRAGSADKDEAAIIQSHRESGDAARYVSVPSRYGGELERCDLVYSKDKALLEKYNCEKVVLKPGAAHAVASGYSLQRRGRWFYVVGPDGTAINEKGLPEDEAAELMRGL
jgi:hypothetical protein